MSVSLPARPTTASMRLTSCHACNLLNPHLLDGFPCARCGAVLYRRKPNGLARTWALLIAAVIFYIPANLLPMMITQSAMMTTQSVFGISHDTILTGIVYLWISGSRVLSILVLIASVVVPLLKMMALTILLLSVHFRSTWRIRQQTRLYRLLEVIGRWSMLDIFVVAMLAALVRAGKLATISPGSGALAFSSVVVLTMLASLSFDPRLLWDSLDANND
ncbi:paraquat-inducible protein A [Collimonas sp. OK607]|uniref:paraquat-inducible protein A n=1 Tax=Collimonas sp. OK607 TaxID=1798194 RepID=UPI0008EAB09F|nr:paraquat-inducible protein A [Collimonas sp. OK607]SFA68829.1 paraquat-inducible protein A [Collimonas sp. OK607]